MTMKRSITWGFFASWIAAGAVIVACGDSTPAPVTPADSATVTATAPTADPTPTTTTTTTADVTPTATTPPTPPPPPPPDMPASFTTAQNAFFAQGDKLNDAVSGASGDCKKMGGPLNKTVSDPAFMKALKDYVAETLKLTADQREVAKTAFKDYQKKFDAMGESINACKKDPGVKAAMDKVKKNIMTAMKPLFDAFAGAMGGAAPPASSAKP